MLMDYLTPVLNSMVFYCLVNMTLHYVLTPPAKLTEREKKDYYGMHISLIHSVFASILGFSAYYYENGINYDTPITMTHIYIIGHSLGYFTYDFIYAEFFGLHDMTMRFHHLFVVLGGFPLYLSSNAGSLGITCCFLTEISNPAMQLRLILKHQGKTDTLLFKVSQYLFVSLFLFNRGVFGTFLNYNSWQYDLNLMILINVSMLYGISCFWNYVIILLLLKEFKGKGVSPTEIFISKLTHFLKKYKTAITVAIFIWAIFMPHVSIYMGYTKYHIRIRNFTII